MEGALGIFQHILITLTSRRLTGFIEYFAPREHIRLIDVAFFEFLLNFFFEFGQLFFDCHIDVACFY